MRFVFFSCCRSGHPASFYDLFIDRAETQEQCVCVCVCHGVTSVHRRWSRYSRVCKRVPGLAESQFSVMSFGRQTHTHPRTDTICRTVQRLTLMHTQTHSVGHPCAQATPIFRVSKWPSDIEYSRNTPQPWSRQSNDPRGAFKMSARLEEQWLKALFYQPVLCFFLDRQWRPRWIQCQLN